MMNTFQFISLVGGAGAPEDNEENKDSALRRLVKSPLPSFPSVEKNISPGPLVLGDEKISPI
jgi:hypothetical protein